MKLDVTRSKKTISLCYGFGGALLLMAALGGVMLGDEVPARPTVQRSTLWNEAAAGDETASQQAQQTLAVARERLMKQEGLTDTARRARLTALDDSMDTYLSMMERLRQIKGRDPNLGSADAKTLLKSASAVVERLEEQESVSDRGDMIDIALKGAALLGLFSLFAGAAQTFPIAGRLTLLRQSWPGHVFLWRER